MESVFEIIAEPNRCAILSLLVSSQQSVGEIERQLRMPQPTVSKHLRVLREAGFVESTVDAQRLTRSVHIALSAEFRVKSDESA
jgi:DNA-binding transcriptional ArsR family regulator